MVGIIVRHLGKEYKIPSSIVASLIFKRDEFILEAGGFISSFQRIQDGIEFEVEVAEFEEATGCITEENDFSEVDPEYSKMIESRNEDWVWNQKLEMFREIESVLKEEGLID